MKNHHPPPEEDKEARPRPAKRLRTPHHPWQRRRKVRVPNVDDDDDDDDDENEDDGDLMDAYQVPANFWQDLIHTPFPQNRPHRPWPSSQVLSSTIIATNSTGGKKETSAVGVADHHHKSPFLQAFYKSVGMMAAVPTTRSSTNLPQEKKLLAAESADADSSHEDSLEDIDNPAFSTLSPSQHRRYRKLEEQTERRTPSERNHWKQLRALVPVEQAKYKTAVSKFWAHHREDRLLLGLSSLASSRSSLGVYCQWACAENRRRNERLLLRGAQHLPQGGGGNPPPIVFGKCRQVLSLRLSAAGKDRHSLPDATSLDMKVLVSGKDDSPRNQTSITLSELPQVGSRIQAPRTTASSSSSSISETTRLQDDLKAMQLATHHEADIMTTDETLETLLGIPGDRTTRWMLFATSVVVANTITSGPATTTGREKRRVIVLETPLAQAYTTPRECLTRGIQEGLYQQAGAAARCSETNNNESGSPRMAVPQQQHNYAYTLWTLPPVTTSTGAARRSQKSLRVLIRSRVRLQWNADTGMKSATNTTDPTIPLKIRAHVEYFPERGQELLSRYERSIWIMDQLLFQQEGGVPKIVTKLCRIDGRNGTLLEWHDTSVAHAFAADEGGENDNPMLGFAQLIQFFQAVSTIDFQGSSSGRRETTSATVDSVLGGHTPFFQKPNCRLLCLPSRETSSRPSSEGGNSLSDPYSVSVHAPYIGNEQTKNVANQDTTVNLEPILQNADGVLLNAKATTQECQRPWKWDVPDRIPYTFPTGTSRTPATTRTTAGASSRKPY